MLDKYDPGRIGVPLSTPYCSLFQVSKQSVLLGLWLEGVQLESLIRGRPLLFTSHLPGERGVSNHSCKDSEKQHTVAHHTPQHLT